MLWCLPAGKGLIIALLIINMHGKKDEVHETKFSWRTRTTVAATVIAIFLLLITILYHLISARQSVFLIAFVVILILAMIPISIFSMDMVFLEEPQ